MVTLKIKSVKRRRTFPNKAGWRVIGGTKLYLRSKLEANYARYLEFLRRCGDILSWEYEPETFWFEKIKRGVRSYTPDFQVFHPNAIIQYVEVKGYMDAKSATKIKRFRKYFPDEKLIVIDQKWFARNNKKLKSIIKDWE